MNQIPSTTESAALHDCVRSSTFTSSPSSIGPLAIFPIVTAALYLLIPVDFVVADAQLTRAIYLCSAATLLLAVALALNTAGSALSWLIFVLLFIASVPLLSAGSGSAIGGLFTLTPIIVGILIAHFCTPKVLAIGAVAMAVILVIESVLQTHWYTALLGTYRFETFGVFDFRARGIIGHPVPAAFIAVVIAVSCAVVFSRRKQWLWLALSAVTLILALAVTGTRSALILALLAIIVVGFRLRSMIESRLLGSVFVLTVVVCAVVSVIVYGNWSATSRLFSFSDLSNSESALVRASALSSLMDLPNTCGTACTLLGHGGRQFENMLMTTPSAFGLNTVDNQFVTVFWDFGLLGLIALAVTLMVSVVVLASSRQSLMAKFGAAIVAMTIVSGAFYDSLYVRPSALLLGIGAGLLLINFSPRSDPFAGRGRVL